MLKVESNHYDKNDNLIFHTDAHGNVTGYVYDALDRLIQTGYGATSTSTPVYSDTIDYQYDAANRLTQANDSINGSITRDYDDRFDSLWHETSSEGTVTYSYYANGKV